MRRYLHYFLSIVVIMKLQTLRSSWHACLLDTAKNFKFKAAKAFITYKVSMRNVQSLFSYKTKDKLCALRGNTFTLN